MTQTRNRGLGASLLVDLLTILLCVPFYMWLDWWGILLAFFIGWCINTWRNRKTKKESIQ